MSLVRSIALATLTATLLVTLPTAAADLPDAKERWTELDTANFAFFSHAGQRATKRIAADLEELRLALARFTTLELNSPVPTYIYVFRNDRDFEPYNLLYQGEPAAVAGYFSSRSHANYIAINGDSRHDASGIIYHEYVHYFAGNNLPGLPLWFEEGLAELYSTFRVFGGKIQFGFGIFEHLVLLNTQALIPLEQLLAVDHDSPLYNERDRKGMFYAESWALVHYLLAGSDQRRPEAIRFLDLVNSGIPYQEAFRQAFTTDIAGLEQELRRYVERRIFRYLELGASVEVDLQAKVERMKHADVLYRLGDLLAHHQPPRPESEAHLRAAVDLDSKHGPALAALGLIAERRAKWSQARGYYQRALAAAPDDPMVQYRGGAFLLERGQELEQAGIALRRSTELDPSFGQAWVDLARVYIASGDYGPEAVRAAEAAHRLLPSREDVARNLLRLYLTNNQRNEALALSELGFPSSSVHRERARSEVLEYDLGRARSLLVEGKMEGAKLQLSEAEAAVAGSANEEFLRERIAAMRAEILQYDATVRYNQAVVAYNRGDLDTARRILLDLEPDLPDGRQADSVRSLLDLIDNPERAAAAETTISYLSGVGREEVERLNQLIAARDLEAARDFLQDLRQSATPDEQVWVDNRIAEIEAALAYDRFVDGYNRAVDQFNGGAFAAAVATLEQLLASQPDATDADEARELLEEARAALAER